MKIKLIVAKDLDNGIGKNGTMPWHLKKDMAFFKSITSTSQNDKRNAVIMGRITWESIPERFRPLPDRQNVVVTRNTNYPLPTDVTRAYSLEEAIHGLTTSHIHSSIDQIFIIGGGQLYKTALDQQLCSQAYVTNIQHKHDCDTFFPPLSAYGFTKNKTLSQESENGIHFSFELYQRG